MRKRTWRCWINCKGVHRPGISRILHTGRKLGSPVWPLWYSLPSILYNHLTFFVSYLCKPIFPRTQLLLLTCPQHNPSRVLQADKPPPTSKPHKSWAHPVYWAISLGHSARNGADGLAEKETGNTTWDVHETEESNKCKGTRYQEWGALYLEKQRRVGVGKLYKMAIRKDS